MRCYFVKRLLLLALSATLLLTGCGKPEPEPVETIVDTQVGVASWYGEVLHGRKTASGERFNAFGYTAAHRDLPFGTYVKVTNPKNAKSVIVKINDRGPQSPKRIIDLSKGAAVAIGLKSAGIGEVHLEILDGYNPEI